VQAFFLSQLLFVMREREREKESILAIKVFKKEFLNYYPK
jgi:hypothetical protein